jgi:aspartate 1-decarboxylase
MQIEMCMAKIHRATVTQAELDYVGSITIDEALIEAAGMREYQYVNITNLRNATFWRTYILKGKRGNGDICLNGPPARLFSPGDKIIILAQVFVTPEEADQVETKVVFVDDKNQMTSTKGHGLVPHPLR